MDKDKESKILDREDAIAMNDKEYTAGPIITVGPFDEFIYALLKCTKDKKKTKQNLNELLDTFELCIPSEVAKDFGRLPRLAKRILAREDGRFNYCDQKILDAVLTAWYEKEQSKKKGNTKHKDPNVTHRRNILRKWGTKDELSDPQKAQKVRSLFGQFQREEIPIPGDTNKSTEWLELLPEKDRNRKEEYVTAISILKKDFSRM